MSTLQKLAATPAAAASTMAEISSSFDEPVVRLRSYQTEMLKLSLEKNIIVAMDTGSGKTHVAIARIQAEVERLNNDTVGWTGSRRGSEGVSDDLLTTQPQLIWFLTPSKTLAEQQHQVLSSNLPAYGIRLLTGADGVEKWTDQRLWDAVLANMKVVVATPAVLRDALMHGFVNISRISLCIFDEGSLLRAFDRLALAKVDRSPPLHQEPSHERHFEALLPPR